MAGKQQETSLSHWADEIEGFLESEAYSGNLSRQEKEITLVSVASQELANASQNVRKGKNAMLCNSSNLETEKAAQMTKQEHKKTRSKCVLVCVCTCIVLFGVIKYGFCRGKSLKLCWNNNIQDLIYPVLRAVRLISLPAVRYFPFITDLHEETCLLENPLYWDSEVDCSLCQDVGVVTLSHADQFEEMFYHKGVPVVVRDAVSRPVGMAELRHMYARHQDDIEAGSGRRLHPARPGPDSLQQLMAAGDDELAALPHCVQWRLLRVSAVRHLRQLFRRPYFISKKTEVSLHRYIYICGTEADRFSLPVTEFANVWVSQHTGTRQIQLTPSSECSAACRTVSALLRSGDTLFYNWRYWRASSLPVPSPLPEQPDPIPAGTEQTTEQPNPSPAGTEQTTEQADPNLAGTEQTWEQPDPNLAGTEQTSEQPDPNLAGTDHTSAQPNPSPAGGDRRTEPAHSAPENGRRPAGRADQAADDSCWAAEFPSLPAAGWPSGWDGAVPSERGHTAERPPLGSREPAEQRWWSTGAGGPVTGQVESGAAGSGQEAEAASLAPPDGDRGVGGSGQEAASPSPGITFVGSFY